MNKDIVLGIRFGDNDFCNLFTHLLRAIADEPSFRGPWWDDREKSLDIINELVYPFYLLSQNPYSYNGHAKDNEKYINHMKSYLKVDKKKFMFGSEEVDKFVQQNDWDNASTFILDTRLPKDQMVYVV